MTSLPPPSAVKLGLVIDLDTCVGCQACVTSCKSWNTQSQPSPLADLTIGPDWDRPRIERLAAALPWTDRLRVPGPGRPLQVAGRPRFLPAGTPPGPIGTVQAPWAGGVVRFRRLRGPERRLWHARRLLRWVTEPIPPPGPEAP